MNLKPHLFILPVAKYNHMLFQIIKQKRSTIVCQNIFVCWEWSFYICWWCRTVLEQCQFVRWKFGYKLFGWLQTLIWTLSISTAILKPGFFVRTDSSFWLNPLSFNDINEFWICNIISKLRLNGNPCVSSSTVAGTKQEKLLLMYAKSVFMSWSANNSFAFLIESEECDRLLIQSIKCLLYWILFFAPLSNNQSSVHETKYRNTAIENKYHPNSSFWR